MSEAIIERLKTKARNSWPGAIGENRATELEIFLRKKLAEYSEKLGYSEEEILEAIEGRRNYSAINYYQEANFPSLNEVRVFETRNALLESIPSKKFRCPCCGGISTNEQECNSGDEMEKGKICDWKAYGLFGTLGKGCAVVVKKEFLEYPYVARMFMPIDWELLA